MGWHPSPKQAHTVATINSGTVKYVAIHGPLRSGKSMSGVAGWLQRCSRHSGRNYGLGAPASKQLDTVFLDALQQLGGRAEKHKFHWTIPGAGNNRFIPYPLGRAGSETPVKGATLHGAYVVEATDCSQAGVDTLFDRTATVEDAIVVLEGNPKHPEHWYHRKFIADNRTERNSQHIGFTLEDPETGECDNPGLPDEARLEIKNRYTGTARDRLYYGLWVGEGGLVYPYVADECFTANLPDEDPWRVDVTIDPAQSGVTHALLVAHYRSSPGVRWYVDEWRHHGELDGYMSYSAKSKAIWNAFAHWAQATGRGYSMWVLDHNPSDMWAALSDFLADQPWGAGRSMIAVKPPVKAGVETVRMGMRRQQIKIGPGLRHLRRELRAYHWDEHLLKRTGEEMPAKKDDHGADGLRNYETSWQESWVLAA